MQNSYSSGESLTPNKFANINKLPENLTQKNNSNKNYSKRTRTLSQETRSDPDHSTKQTSETHQKSNERKAHRSSASSLQSQVKSRNPLKRCFHWTTQCCRAPQRKKASKRRKDFWKRLKERVKRCSRKRKKTGVAEQISTSTAEYPESSETVNKKRSSKDVDEVRGKRTKSQKRRSKDAAATSDAFDASVDPSLPADQNERFITDLIQEKGFPDFTKSCCYMCANAMALIGASGGAHKLHASIQTSESFKEKFDKSSSPMSYVRTVQSSVKVKMRNVGTHYSEEKKSKKPRLKLKNLKDAVSRKFPKIPNTKESKKPQAQKGEAEKVSKPPKTRTVACGTDTSTKHTNTPQCTAKHGTQCVREKK